MSEGLSQYLPDEDFQNFITNGDYQNLDLVKFIDDNSMVNYVPPPVQDHLLNGKQLKVEYSSPEKMPELSADPQFISNEDYPGPYNFEVYINPHHGNKSPWVYSASLGKVFIQMNTKFPVDFKWEGPTDNLFIRATPLFSSPQYSQELVTRCYQHVQGNDPNNKDTLESIWDHIIRCTNQQTIYDGSKSANKHLSIVTPLGRIQAGNDTFRLMYLFVCKNSCAGGMNRRPIEVVFTLEDEGCNILGRKIVNVRICSCPKRDKEKEEVEHYKSGSKTAAAPQGKKRKMEKKPSSFTESLDMKEYDVNLKIIGKHNYKAVLKYAHDLVAGDMVRYNVGAEPQYKKCISELSLKMNNPSE